MENILCFLKTYQILVAGIVGFTGVTVTMIANAYMNRSQHSRGVDHERQTLRSALRAELTANKEAYELRMEQFSEPKSDNHALMPNKVLDRVYSTLLGKIGILEVDEIDKITRAYQSLLEVPYRVRILVGTDNVGGIDNEYIRLKPEHIDTVCKLHGSMLPKIVEAIDSIESEASMHNK